ncbi:alpha/beta fold hydrolase [Chitinophaga filiformis]|uniref:Pimeloyl-ACP methyl ester carboxylesterase n=1 Tax=Chitinophaga filiformis TaxID=104663 RepID=A0A1G8B0Y1_CHIFI|nr:alpha/beta hydrolase [Chitinophaga filiformis]SDH26806.1 Pimeloyl-ACP methyl ester carboxylesterase [Chitinophaga filiformis]
MTQSTILGIDINRVQYKTLTIEGQEIFYREAGSPDKPTLLLLHGYPTSSFMFRNLMIALGDKYHLVAPDYPGFGNSSMPLVNEFEYTFDHMAEIVDQFITAKGLKKYSLYVMDYGAPVGYRIATKHPEKVQALLVQNGNAYKEGLSPFWEPLYAFWADPENEEKRKVVAGMLSLEGTKWQYLTGVKDPSRISPDAWQHDQSKLDRPGNADIQMAMFYSYRTNPEHYAEWQSYFRTYQPPTLITWGANDEIFPASGARAYLKDLPSAELHILDTGHFALEEEGTKIASLIDRFLVANDIR